MTEPPPSDILQAVEAAVEQLHAAEQLRDQALEQRRQLCHELHAQGLSFRQIGEIIGVDSARVFRIMTRNAPPLNPRTKTGAS